jgi:hypothetical protein
MHSDVIRELLVLPLVGVVSICTMGLAQEPVPLRKTTDEAEVMSEPIPPEVVDSATAAVAKLGEEVVLGRYQVAIERMNPAWKESTAARMGGMAALENKLSGVAAEMMRQGISMISFKPQGKPQAFEVGLGKRMVTENGVTLERYVFTKWLVLVPTITKFRIMREGDVRPLLIESIGYQVAISDKAKQDWTFIDGAGLSTADLRNMFGTLPHDMELPVLSKREVR